LAGFEVTLYGRFWVTPEAEAQCSYLGQIALRLKEKRERADYRPLYPRIHEEVKGVLEDAQEFALRLDKLPPRFPNPKSVRS
jgi:hypothetical protein